MIAHRSVRREPFTLPAIMLIVAGLTNEQLTAAITDNTILPDGHIKGLELLAGQTLPVRDYDGRIAISIDNGMTLTEGSSLDIILADSTWGSTITLASGFTPDLGGTLLTTLYTIGEVTFTGVPEPATASLLVLGGLILTRKRVIRTS